MAGDSGESWDNWLGRQLGQVDRSRVIVEKKAQKIIFEPHEGEAPYTISSQSDGVVRPE